MAWWPFNRRRKAAPGVETPPASHGDSAENWEVGDLAQSLCGTWFVVENGLPVAGPVEGEVYRVSNVRLHPVHKAQQIELHPKFPRTWWWDARLFRKITPRPDAAEAADSDFINSLTKVQS